MNKIFFETFEYLKEEPGTDMMDFASSTDADIKSVATPAEKIGWIRKGGRWVKGKVGAAGAGVKKNWNKLGPKSKVAAGTAMVATSLYGAYKYGKKKGQQQQQQQQKS